MTISKKRFGTTQDGEQADIFIFTNRSGMTAKVTNFGGIIVSLSAADANGEFSDVVLGFDSLAEYQNYPDPYFGAAIGRFGNRICKGQFTLNGVNIKLPVINNAENNLHGGGKGFDKVVWDAEIVDDSLVLKYLSIDGEEGFPGNLETTIIYTLTEENEFKIEYQAATDKDTVVNLTNHTYFNLAGEGSALDHELQLNASQFVPVNDQAIPVGGYTDVAGTPMDFTTAVVVGTRIDEDYEQLKNCAGYDHSYVIGDNGVMKQFATLVDPQSGRVMQMSTTEPGVQFYAGNFIGDVKGKGGTEYHNRYGLCFETQHHPDSPNNADFPTTVLKAGDTFNSTTIYAFSAK